MEIRELKSEVVDKIAAGEVVERPSHLLKELIENSIDAGADEISIEVNDGGKSLSVTDNGKGVLSEELPLVFARHATSKIQDSEDLWKLSTFGFRGEALASISSVSRLDFISRRKGSEHAYAVHCEFGQVGEVLETSFQEGTQVQVTDLFSNIPARLKFLKSDSAELTQIKNVVKAMALQYPGVYWKLKNKGQLVFLFQATDSLLQRAKDVLETQSLYENTFEYEGFRSHVIFSDPAHVVRVSRQIWTFVQNRWVQDRGLQAAVMEAYRSLLMHGQYPVCYVSVQCPPDEVDVNIHPTKSAVKFVDPKKAFRVVHYALREAIEKAPWQTHAKVERAVVVPEENESFQGTSFEKTQFKQKSLQRSGHPHNPTYKPGEVNIETLKAAALRETENVLDDILSDKDSSLRSESPDLEQGSSETKGFWSQLQVIGQVDLTYIVAQSKDKMVLIDQHAAHERVAFERLMRAWKHGGRIDVQRLLLPLTIDLEEPEVEALLSVQVELKKMGVDMEQEGPSSLAISTLPSIIREKGLVEALKKLAFEMNDKGGSFAFETTIGDIFATMACHSVIRAGQALSQAEMEQLLKDMDEFPLSSFCPHGRSVSLNFSFVSLEKDFGRRV
jgi:DNA mismatch repair protein MutL